MCFERSNTESLAAGGVELNPLHLFGTVFSSRHSFPFTLWVSAFLLTRTSVYCLIEELFIYSSKELRIAMANFTPLF